MFQRRLTFGQNSASSKDSGLTQKQAAAVYLSFSIGLLVLKGATTVSKLGVQHVADAGVYFREGDSNFITSAEAIVCKGVWGLL
jgi:hypothetical protein